MNAHQAVDQLKRGNRVTVSHVNSDVFYGMCHGDLIVALNKRDCQNKITAEVDRIETTDDFIRRMTAFRFRLYEEN